MQFTRSSSLHCSTILFSKRKYVLGILCEIDTDWDGLQVGVSELTVNYAYLLKYIYIFCVW